ncbi:MAG: DUF6265 family protein [Bacteroidota bacterium]
MKKIVLPFTIIVLLAACAAEPAAESTEESTTEPTYEAHKQASWLLGRWENNSDQGNMSEVWEKKNDSLYVGASYFEAGGDTLFSESIELIEKEGVLNYVVTIAESGQGPTTFKLTKSSDTELIFENPKHDFPQKITYNHKGDSVIAVISGKQGGKAHKEVFAMKKIN